MLAHHIQKKILLMIFDQKLLQNSLEIVELRKKLKIEMKLYLSVTFKVLSKLVLSNNDC